MSFNSTLIISNISLSNIFILSLVTSTLVLISGFILLILNSQAQFILLGIFLIIVGVIQIFADIGWIGIIKINRPDEIKTWSESLVFVATRKGQKLFLIPIIIDILFILTASILLFRIV